MNKRFALLAFIPLLAACSTSRGYDAEPVVGPHDHREIDVPALDDDEMLKDQKCWRIELWADGTLRWQENGNRNVGIACLVEED